MAHVDFVLAVVAVSDIEAGRAWYTKLFGREPDNNPMPNLVEWQVTDGGWVQVTEDPLRAGNHGLRVGLVGASHVGRLVIERATRC